MNLPSSELPAWLAKLHVLELRSFCHLCIAELPTHLGFDEAAIYLHDAHQNILSLAETNSRHYVDLAIALDGEPLHLLAAVARSREVLATDDLAEYCRQRGLNCPRDAESRPECAALVVPLTAENRLEGVLRLSGRKGGAGMPTVSSLDGVFAFLGRGLRHARLYRRARVEARVDRLTGLFNYRWMIEALEKEIRRAQRYATPLALLMIDLDGLKSVNDRYGHTAGDALIRHAAGRIAAGLRQIDSAARVGGDEFLVLLPATGITGAQHVAQRIHRALHTDAPVINQRIVPISASLGLAQWQDGWDSRQLLEAADNAMYAAKRSSRSTQ